MEDLNEKIDTHIEFAAIQYMGEAGSTEDCKGAIIKLLQYGDKIHKATILTWSGRHGLLLTINEGDLVAIKSGFRLRIHW